MSRSGDTEPIVTTGQGAAQARSGRFTSPWPRSRNTAAAPDQPTVAVAPTAAKRKRSRVRELGKWIAAFLVLALLASPLLAGSLLAAVYWQARTDESRPVDAIVVLGTAQYNGRPSPVLRARLERTLEVYEAGLAPLVVATGGKEEEDVFTEAEASRDYLLERGVPESAILLEKEGRDSWQSMQGVADLLRARGLASVLLVSDGFHLLRVKLMARELGLTAYATAAEESPIREWGGGEFGYAVREVVGIAVFLWQERVV